MGPYFFAAEKAVKASRPDAKGRKTIVQLLEEVRADKKLSSAAHWDDGNKVRDGILQRAPDEMLKYASQYTVSESELEEKTAEMINASSKSPKPTQADLPLHRHNPKMYKD